MRSPLLLVALRVIAVVAAMCHAPPPRTVSRKEMWQRITSTNFGVLVASFAELHSDWSPKRIEEAFSTFRQFLYLVGTSRKRVRMAPCSDMEELWRHFLQMKECAEVCHKLFDGDTPFRSSYEFEDIAVRLSRSASQGCIDAAFSCPANAPNGIALMYMKTESRPPFALWWYEYLQREGHAVIPIDYNPHLHTFCLRAPGSAFANAREELEEFVSTDEDMGEIGVSVS